MKKTELFTFRTVRSFDTKREYRDILEVIERIKSRCPNYTIRESFGGHPANAFDSMALPENENEKFLADNFLLFYDSADNLLDINKSISGKYGWNQIADVVETQSGIGINDWHWTLKSYKLKAEYAQLLIENLNILEEEIRKNYDSFLAEERKKETERESIRQSIATISTSEKSIIDEGGKTKEYTHTITFHDREQLIFTERNVFDFGVVINPSYSVEPGKNPGGVSWIHDDGHFYWHDFVSGDGWGPVRELTENELTAIRYLKTFGKFANSGVRM